MINKLPNPSPVLANLIKPFSPHEVPIEFFTLIKSGPNPTAVTPWLILEPLHKGSLNIPPL